MGKAENRNGRPPHAPGIAATLSPVLARPRPALKESLHTGRLFDIVGCGKGTCMGLPLFSSDPLQRTQRGLISKNKAGEDCPRRFCLRNAFEQVYPHDG